MGAALDIGHIEEELLYKYETIEDAPPEHRRVIRFAIQRLDIPTIEQLTSVSRDVIHKILHHPPNKKYLEMREFQVRAEQTIVLEMMGEGRMKVLELIQERIEEFGPSMKTRDLLALANFYADRHPDGGLVKRQKTEITNNHNLVDGHKLENLRRLAAQAGINEAQKAIKVDAEEVTDE